MNTLPASEIKRRGISAADDLLKKGPVHVIKNNRPQYVIQSEDDYQAALAHKNKKQTPRLKPDSVWAFIRNRPWRGTKTKAEIDAIVAEERASWSEDD
jgi:hypothetical protein